MIKSFISFVNKIRSFFISLLPFIIFSSLLINTTMIVYLLKELLINLSYSIKKTI